MLKAGYSIIISLILILFLLEIIVGSANIPLSELFSSDPNVSLILQMRLMRALSAFFIGGGLAIAGLTLQTLFSNPIAGPYVLGISSGASLGVAVATILFPTSLLLSLPFCASLGAMFVAFLVSSVALRSRNRMTVLLVGLMLSYILGALISMLVSISEESSLMRYTFWTLGSLVNISLQNIIVLAIIFVLVLSLLLFHNRKLDILSTGDEYALTLGLDVRFYRGLFLLLISLLTAVSVSFAGPIAFIGTASPHVARWISRRSTHRDLLLLSSLIGSLFLLLADLVSRLNIFNAFLPLNTITALFGTPIILYIILSSRNK